MSGTYYGPSNDYSSIIYQYREGKLIEIGTVEGLFNEGLGIDGKGNVMSRTRVQILQTWYMHKPYKLAAGVLQENGTIYQTDHKVFTKIDLPVYTMNELESETFIIPEGTVATLTATDDKRWCEITTEDGNKGWFFVVGWYDELGIPGQAGKIEEVKAIDVFAGLTYYD